jgi:hypothetical protein
MEFIVHVPDGEDSYHGESRYRIGETNGVLTVYTEDDKVLLYGPAGWLRLEEQEPPAGAAVF